MTDFDTEIAALEQQIVAAKAAKEAASADSAKAAKIAELKAQLAALGETSVIAAPVSIPSGYTNLTQVGKEPYVEVAGTTLGAVVGPVSGLIQHVAEDGSYPSNPAPTPAVEEGTIKVVES